MRLHFHSDCRFFAGCENMLACLFGSALVRAKHAVTFSYRRSRAYEQGLAARIPNAPTVFPLILCTGAAPLAAGLLPRVVARAVQARPLGFVYDVARLRRLLQQIRPDVLHINNGGFPGALSCLAASVAGRLAGVPARLMTVNNLAVGYDRLSRYLDRPIDQLAVQSTTLFLTGSQAAGRRLGEMLGIEADRVVTIPNTILDRPLIEGRDATRRRLGLRSEHLVLGTVALLEERKGVHVLIEALQTVRKRFEAFASVRVVIEGIGPEKVRLVQAVHAADLSSHVVFVEREARILELIQCLDIFVLPSIANEDFPNVVLEAMSLGKPIVGSDLGGIPEQIAHGVNGFLVPPGESKTLADALERLLQDESLRRRMGWEGRARFERLFSYDRVIAEYMALYDRLATAPPEFRRKSRCPDLAGGGGSGREAGLSAYLG